MKGFALLAAALVTAAMAMAYAQDQPRRQPQVISPSSSGGYYGGGYPVYSHSSTAAEGAMRGLGDVVRAQGQANLDNSAAAINYSVARSNELENQKQYTETYFAKKEMNRRARAAARRPRATMEDLVRYAQRGKPKPLSPSELDTVTGAIHWPVLLKSEPFERDAEKLQKVFSYRAQGEAISNSEYREVRQVTKKMLADLKGQIREVSSAEYTTSKRFLQSLAYAAGQPTS